MVITGSCYYMANQNGLTMRKIIQLSSYIALLIAMLFTLALSPLGLKAASLWVHYNTNIQVQNISGSLWSGDIQIRDVYVKNHGVTIHCQDLDIKGLNLLRQTILAIKSSSLEITIKDLSQFKKSRSNASLAWKLDEASIETVSLNAGALLKPLILKNMTYHQKNNEHIIEFSYKDKSTTYLQNPYHKESTKSS